MYKPYYRSTERYNTVRECIEAQFKEYNIRSCMYSFLPNGIGCFQLLDSQSAVDATPEEMLDIAVKHFEEYGQVEFEGIGNGDIYQICCYDEHAFGSPIEMKLLAKDIGEAIKEQIRLNNELAKVKEKRFDMSKTYTEVYQKSFESKMGLKKGDKTTIDGEELFYDGVELNVIHLCARFRYPKKDKPSKKVKLVDLQDLGFEYEEIKRK